MARTILQGIPAAYSLHKNATEFMETITEATIVATFNHRHLALCKACAPLAKFSTTAILLAWNSAASPYTATNIKMTAVTARLKLITTRSPSRQQAIDQYLSWHWNRQLYTWYYQITTEVTLQNRKTTYRSLSFQFLRAVLWPILLCLYWSSVEI